MKITNESHPRTSGAYEVKRGHPPKKYSDPARLRNQSSTSKENTIYLEKLKQILLIALITNLVSQFFGGIFVYLLAISVLICH